MRDEKGRFLKGCISWNKGKIGKNNPFWRKQHLDEAKRKIREAKLKNNPGAFKEGKNHPNWKGGKKISYGYVLILKPDHPYSPIDGYVRQSRLIAEKFLGRLLMPSETTHHRNGKRDDDKCDNLFVFESKSDHTKYEHFLRRK